MKRIAVAVVLAGLLWLSACGLKSKGLIVMLDDSYQATITGTNKLGFGAPDGLWWRAGRLYLADEGAGAIEVLDAEQRLTTLCDTRLGISSPEDLVMDAEGNVYFTDDDVGGVWKVDAHGRSSLLAGKDKGLISTEGIALAPDGSLVVGDGEKHTVFRVGRGGEVSTLLGPERGIKKPESMAFNEQGDLYIADNEDNVLYVLDKQGELRRVIERRQNFSPESICYARGVLYLTDSRNAKLCRYTPRDGLKTIAVFGGKLKNIQGVTVSDDGEIYVSIQTDLKHKVGYLVKLSPLSRD